MPLEVRPRPRSRVEARRCPFCRDAVGSETARACARDGCGALYHGECWDECSRQYGGCAVFGCSSQRALPTRREPVWPKVRAALADYLELIRREGRARWWLPLVASGVPAVITFLLVLRMEESVLSAACHALAWFLMWPVALIFAGCVFALDAALTSGRD